VAALYRFIPDRPPREHGDLASNGGVLEALVVSGQPNFDANGANPGDRYEVEWVTIEEPNPLTDTVREEAQSKGAAIFDRTEGAWEGSGRLYFDCTTGGEAQLGQLWQYTPRGRGRGGGELELIYESTSIDDLEGPDNLVVVPHTGDVFLQEDASNDKYIRGVNRRGEIYDFAPHRPQQHGVLRRLLQPRRQDVFRQPAGRPPRRRRESPRRRGAHLRDLGSVRPGIVPQPLSRPRPRPDCRG
jgi:uncharacterized protein